MTVALSTSSILRVRLSFNLHWKNYNEPSPREGGERAKKPTTHWSYILLVLNLNFFLTFSLLIFTTILSCQYYPSDGETEAEEPK